MSSAMASGIGKSMLGLWLLVMLFGMGGCKFWPLTGFDPPRAQPKTDSSPVVKRYQLLMVDETTASTQPDHR